MSTSATPQASVSLEPGEQHRGAATSYGQILKSSSVLGGAQALNYLIAMVRVKVVAILLGPAGVGVVSLYQSLTAMVGTVTGLGLASSGVMSVAEAHGTGDPARTAVAIKIVKRVSYVTGFSGWIITAALSYPLSLWTFGTYEHALAIAILGASILLTTLSGAQTALVQGLRRIGDIARIQVLSMIFGTAVSIGLYAWLREDGIVPVLVASAAISLASSWWYVSKIELVEVPLDWRQTWDGSRRMVSLGMALMWSAVLGAGVQLAIRSVIVQDFGIDANGIFQAAWGISGMFAGFILVAMGTDFFPRLAQIAHDRTRINKMVNEQTEVAILLAFPGLLGTMVFAPHLMKIFYSSKFLEGAVLLPWFVLGVFFKVVSWPMGFIMLAKGATRWFVLTESVFGILQLLLTIGFLRVNGLQGAAHAYAVLLALYILTMLAVGRILSGFAWSRESLILLLTTFVAVSGSFLLQKFASVNATLAVGTILFVSSAVVSMRGIVARLGTENKWVGILARAPFAKLLFGVAS